MSSSSGVTRHGDVPPTVPGVRFMYMFHNSASAMSRDGLGRVLLLCPRNLPPPPLLEYGMRVTFRSSLSSPIPPARIEKNGMPSAASPAMTLGSSRDMCPNVAENPSSAEYSSRRWDWGWSW